jgi:ribosomal protein S12 methylthiotransferase
MKKTKIGIISLGCARNLVDSEIILGRLSKKGYRIVGIEKADIGIINTCSFIKEAKEESLEVISEVIGLKKEGKLRKIIVTGCLPQRYQEELIKNFKDIDAFVGRLNLDDKLNFQHFSLTQKHFAYVKICESCVNKCSYCVIPKIKGKFTSRSIESIIEEVKVLDKNKTREINIIGQDTTSFGIDRYNSARLTQLLKRLARVADNIKWIRLLYTHPYHFNDSLIEVIKKEDKICKYIDLPLQHINDRILRLMNRRITKAKTLNLIEKIRENIPGVAIRTSIIVGFPGEREEDFRELMEFVKTQRFERLGVFKYSREEGTPAYNFPDQIPEKVKQKRLDLLMSCQQDIARKVNERFLNKKMQVLIDERDEKGENIYLGRSQFDAPEVDGLVYVHARNKLHPGDFVTVKITDTLEYDLVGEQVVK